MFYLINRAKFNEVIIFNYVLVFVTDKAYYIIYLDNLKTIILFCQIFIFIFYIILFIKYVILFFIFFIIINLKI